MKVAIGAVEMFLGLATLVIGFMFGLEIIVAPEFLNGNIIAFLIMVTGMVLMVRAAGWFDEATADKKRRRQRRRGRR